MTPLFRRLLGPALDTLSPAVRAAHDGDGDLSFTGTAGIEANRHPIARLLCRMMKLPAPGDGVPVTVRFSPRDGGERWHRTFGRHSYTSDLSERDGLLHERMGPATNIFRLAAVDGSLRFDLVAFRFLGLPLPAALRPRCVAVERDDGGALTFDIPISLAWLGPILHYRGRLTPAPAAAADAAVPGDDAVPADPGQGHPIILFDARCVLCSANARFILHHDKARRFRLAAMQGAVGSELFRRHGIDPDDPDTIIVVDGDTACRDSDAVLAIYAGLGWPWRLAGLFAVVPKAWRDPPYRWIARHRYRLFGRRETCWLPTAEWRDRLL